jgi:DNA-binding response OmpR family regulator
MPVVAVIDDEPMICELVDEVLHDAGSDVHIATTAEAGAALLTSRYFDLALIDVLLRDASGILLAEIAANQNTPVLLVTGHAETALRLRQFDFPHLTKPFDTRLLSEAAARAMVDRHRNIQRLIDGLARLRAKLAGLDVETKNALLLVARSREILAMAAAQRTQCHGSSAAGFVRAGPPC